MHPSSCGHKYKDLVERNTALTFARTQTYATHLKDLAVSLAETQMLIAVEDLNLQPDSREFLYSFSLESMGALSLWNSKCTGNKKKPRFPKGTGSTSYKSTGVKPAW